MARDKNTFVDSVDEQIRKAVADTVPKPVDGVLNFSGSPRKGGVGRPQILAKDKATADKLNAPIFPDGKAPYKRTILQVPPLGKDTLGNPTVIPASINNQLLQRIEGGAESFVNEQKKNFESERKFAETGKSEYPTGFELVGDTYRVDPNKEELRQQTIARQSRVPTPNLINFKKRDSPVPLTDMGFDAPAYSSDENRIIGVDPNRAESPSYGLTSSYPSGFKANVAGRRVDGLPPAGPINVIESIDVLQHEANHSYLNDKSIRNVDGSPYEAPPSSDPNMQDPEGTGSYQTSDDYEWSQGVTSGLNGMRDITGRKLNTPFEVHKLLDEVEANPAILDNLGDENARIFRSYLKIKEENPKSAERMRNSIVRDSKYLVKNDSSDYLKSLRNV